MLTLRSVEIGQCVQDVAASRRGLQGPRALNTQANRTQCGGRHLATPRHRSHAVAVLLARSVPLFEKHEMTFELLNRFLTVLCRQCGALPATSAACARQTDHRNRLLRSHGNIDDLSCQFSRKGCETDLVSRRAPRLNSVPQSKATQSVTMTICGMCFCTAERTLCQWWHHTSAHRLASGAPSHAVITATFKPICSRNGVVICCSHQTMSLRRCR